MKKKKFTGTLENEKFTRKQSVRAESKHQARSKLLRGYRFMNCKGQRKTSVLVSGIHPEC